MDWLTSVAIFSLHDRSIEGRSFCKLRSRLLVAAGGGLCFDCQHPTPRRIRSMGQPFRIAAVNKKIHVRSIRAKGHDSKPLADKKSDIGKRSGVGLTNENLRLAPNRCFSLAGL